MLHVTSRSCKKKNLQNLIHFIIVEPLTCLLTIWWNTEKKSLAYQIFYRAGIDIRQQTKLNPVYVLRQVPSIHHIIAAVVRASSTKSLNFDIVKHLGTCDFVVNLTSTIWYCSSMILVCFNSFYIGRELVDEALKRKSGDNLSVVVVCFNQKPPPVLTSPRPRVHRSISAEGLKGLQGFLDSLSNWYLKR